MNPSRIDTPVSIVVDTWIFKYLNGGLFGDVSLHRARDIESADRIEFSINWTGWSDKPWSVVRKTSKTVPVDDMEPQPPSIHMRFASIGELREFVIQTIKTQDCSLWVKKLAIVSTASEESFNEDRPVFFDFKIVETIPGSDLWRSDRKSVYRGKEAAMNSACGFGGIETHNIAITDWSAEKEKKLEVLREAFKELAKQIGSKIVKDVEKFISSIPTDCKAWKLGQ